MIGDGQGAFIGAVHRIAAHMDNEYKLVYEVFANLYRNFALTVKAGLAGKTATPEELYYHALKKVFAVWHLLKMG
jgi:hypothetical protein